jgi:hypothetical protein
MNFLNYKFKNRFLIIIFIICLIVDGFLIFKYFTIASKKAFVDSLNIYPKSSYEVKVKEITSTLPNIQNFFFLATIVNSPYIDKKNDEYILPLQFVDRKKNKNIINLILGSKNREISVLLAPEGFIPEGEFKSSKVSSIIRNLKIGNSIIIGITVFSDEGIKIVKNRSSCNKLCQQSLKQVKELSNNTILFYKYLISAQNTKKTLNIGYPNSVIIYE